MDTAQRARRAPQTAATWLPIAIAVASFTISIYTLIAASRPPALQVVLPQQIRLVQGDPGGYAYLYFQPTLVHAGRSEQVEVVRGMRLEFTPPQGEPAAFTWQESGRMDFDPATRSVTYVYEGDAAPLLLSRQTAQSPLATFYGPPGRRFAAGRYRAELVVERAVAGSPLRVPFTFELTDEDVAALDAGGSTRFLPIPITATK